MKRSIIICLFFGTLILTGCSVPEKKISKFDFTGPRDPSLIRGFNYTPAGVATPRHHIDTWVNYDSAAIEFDLDLAKSLNLFILKIKKRCLQN